MLNVCPGDAVSQLLLFGKLLEMKKMRGIAPGAQVCHGCNSVASYPIFQKLQVQDQLEHLRNQPHATGSHVLSSQEAVPILVQGFEHFPEGK